jgi:hypothetical protein
MPLKLYQNLMKLGRLRRGIAIFLLAFAFFDLSIVDVFFPQLCGDEQVSSSSASPGEAPEKIANEKLSIRSHDSQQTQDSSQSSIDEDCFCCCSHIIPGVIVNVADMNGAPQPHDPRIASLPSSPPHGAFHPPRLS